jgi:hypothetical protein
MSDVNSNPRKQKIIEAYGKDPETLDELVEAAIATMNSLNPRDMFGHSRSTKKIKVVGFALDINYSPRVSNSHRSPINGKTNWWVKEGDGPVGYPGWAGRVWVRYSENSEFGFGGDPLDAALIYYGTGGFGGYDGPWQKLGSARYKRYGCHAPKDAYPEPRYYSHDCKIFLDDFPALYAKVMEAETFATLSGQGNEFHSYKFSWTDPDVLAADESFMAECEEILLTAK